jgi:hypothetical protein
MRGIYFFFAEKGGYILFLRRKKKYQKELLKRRYPLKNFLCLGISFANRGEDKAEAKEGIRY